MRLSLSGTHLRVSSKVDQMTCCRPACFAAWAMLLGLVELLLRREVFPEECDAVGAVGAFESLLEALQVLDVGLNNLGTQLGQFLGLFRVDVSRERTCGETAARVTQDGTDQPASLRAGRTCYCYGLSFQPQCSPFWNLKHTRWPELYLTGPPTKHPVAGIIEALVKLKHLRDSDE